jgi:LCP family protein required for cell wall assembly
VGGPGAGGSAAAAGTRLRRPLLIAVAALLILAVAGAAFLLSRPRIDASVPGQTASPVASPETSPAPSPTPTPTPTPEPPPVALNILLVGSDSRVNARAQAASGARSDQRGDVLVFIHLPADRQSVYGISIMRDLWVDIPGYGAAKANAALELGGLPLQTQTIAALLGQRIDHAVMLDFEGFSALTDALGGIEIDVKVPFSSTVDNFYDYPVGVNRLNGSQALSFVRERYAFIDGDYQRVRNQQTFLKAALAKLLNEGGLADRDTVRKLVRTVLPHVTVDAGFTLESLENLAHSLRALSPARGVFFTLPTAGTGTSRDGQSIVRQDPAATAAVSAALANQSLAEYVAAHNLQNGN